MLVNLLWFALGLAALVAGAELLVRGASALASRFGISPLVIGLTVVSMGTSAPEVAVSVGAALDGRAGLAIGNAVGSNVVNVLLILGLAAVITPLAVNAQLIRQEVPVMIGASLLLLLLMLDGRLARGEGAFLLALLAAYTVFIVRQSRRQTQATQQQFAHQLDRRAGVAAGRPAWRSHWAVQCLLVAGGLLALVVGADWLVQAAVALASAFGVSDLVIGLTIVAAGTSAPEIAASVVAAVRGERDIAVGNVVGSNIFNILGCLGLAAAVAPPGLAVPSAVMHFDVWVMLAAAVACLPIFVSGRQIARWEGGLFLFYYVAYVAYLVLAAREHALLPAFSGAMLSFVIPLTLVTLVVTLLRPAPHPEP
jgi:cation:H+ antiporter